jgi:hypothetical protein
MTKLEPTNEVLRSRIADEMADTLTKNWKWKSTISASMNI